MDSQQLQEITKDPRKALDIAKTHKKEGKYKEALEMHEWFHFNVLSIEQSFYGVRLSFALADWMELSEVYPMAKQRLIEIREEDIKTIKNGDWKFENFHDIQAISSYLNENQTTIVIFKWIDKNESDGAKIQKCFKSLFKHLIEEVELCNKYLIDPVAWVKDCRQRYEGLDKFEKEYVQIKNISRRPPAMAEKGYIEDVSILVKALKLANRNKDIEAVYEAGKNVISNEEYEQIFE